MDIGTEMMRVSARQIASPNVVFKGNKTSNGGEGAWNLRDLKLVAAPALRSIAFVFFGTT